jgi:hypothetical protein
MNAISQRPVPREQWNPRAPQSLKMTKQTLETTSRESARQGSVRVAASRTAPLLIGALLLSLVAGGCRFALPKPKVKESVHSQQDVAASYNQVRLRLRALVGPMTGELEQAADQIIAGTTNAAVQRAALVWKMEGVPALRAALFQPDPYTALFDSWVLCNQMADYFDAGPGKTALGESSPTAVAACRRLEEQMNGVASSMSISGDVTKGRAFAKKWAGQHPIRHSIADRESTLSRALERDGTGSVSAGEAVAEITTTVDDLNRRLEVYSDQLFRQARWEAELFKSDLLAELPLAQALPLAERAVKSAEQALATLDRLAPAVERAVGVAETAPKLIASEREAAIKALQDELTRTIKFVQAERIAALEQLTKERVAALNDLQATIVAERKALSQDLEQTSLKLVDHATWRAAQLLAAALVVLAVGLAVAVVVLRRKPAKHP